MDKVRSTHTHTSLSSVSLDYRCSKLIDKLRGIWKFYIKNCEGLFYVVDSSDRERIELARIELFNLLDFEDMKKIPVIIICNKQDVNSCLSITEIAKYMRLDDMPNKYFLYGSCAKTGKGLKAAFECMAEIVKKIRGIS